MDVLKTKKKKSQKTASFTDSTNTIVKKFVHTMDAEFFISFIALNLRHENHLSRNCIPIGGDGKLYIGIDSIKLY